MKYNFTCGRTCAFMHACRFQPIFAALGRTRVVSHVTKVDVEIRDLDAMETVCKRRGLALHRNQQKYAWWGRSVGDYPIPAGMTVADLGKCSHAIHLNSRSFEIGLVAQSDNSYRLIFDFYGQHELLAAVGGQECEGLIGDYTIETARNAANAQMWPVSDCADGAIIIYHPSGGTLTVNRDGTVDANGFVGSGCTVASVIENALGAKQETTLKPEYYVLRERLRAN